MKYNRPEDIRRIDEGETEKKARKAQKAMREYATEVEIREMVNRKIIKLRCDLIYGPEKPDAEYENRPLDFNYYDNISV